MLKKIPKALPSFIITGAKLFLLEFMVLSGCRLMFYFLFRTVDGAATDNALILKAFAMGLEFDIVASTYAMFLPFFLLILNELFHRRTLAFHKAARIATLIIFLLYALVSAADLPYYKQFNSHLNRQAFLWAASPAFVLRMIFGNISYYGYFFLFIVLAVIIYKVVKQIYVVHLQRLQRSQLTTAKILVGTVLLVPFLILGARGRLSSKSTVHEGLAIVSDNVFINQVALNPNFTFFRSVFFQKIKGYRVPADIDASIAYARRYLGITGPYERSVSRQQAADSAFKPYNVVIVCMESMSAYKTGIQGREELTPNLNRLIKESVYFDNFFSSGIHTFNGLFSTCAGYPSMLTDHALRRYTKKPFTTLGNLLLQKNYQTYLGVTHDPVFDNMQGFFTFNGYKNILSAENFPRNKVLSATGVPDHELYRLFIQTINKAGSQQPFLGFLMTGSDHGPWAVPEDIAFKPDAATEEKRATQYADWAIGELMKEAKKQSWYANTLFVFLGDHGYAINGTYEMPLSYNHIPLILHKPGSLKPATIHSPGYQPDVTSTVCGVLNLPFINSTFGINLLKEKHPFVYFTADDKVGCVDSAGYFFYELITQKAKRLKQYRQLDQQDYYVAQKPRADSLDKAARRLLDAAEYFIREDYFSY